MSTRQNRRGTRTSSADPFVLATYATSGTAMVTTLSGQVTTLSGAVDRLIAAGQTIPGLADLVTSLVDLTADWCHLDEWAGDVAAEFQAQLPTGFAHDGSPFVMTLDDGVLADGHLGLADRDAAIAYAQELAAEYQALLDTLDAGDRLVWDPPGEGGMSLATIDGLGALVEAYQHDPAFAVTFVEALGVRGIVGLRELYRSYAHEASDADRPRGHDWSDGAIDEWVDGQMAGVGGVVTTAMDTRRSTSARIDPGNAGLGGGARLDEDWVDGFEDYVGEAQLDYSLLVLDADLPSDVLVAIADNHLDAHLGQEARADPGDGGLASGPTPVIEADLNIAAAIAADPDASVSWLTSDGIAAGTGNLELILTTATDGEIHAAFADVVESGLTHPSDREGRSVLMEEAIRIVGDEDGGGLPTPLGTDAEAATGAMRVALGNGAAANMDVVHRLITEDWDDATFGQYPPNDAFLTHDFLREVMEDEKAAEVVHGGYGPFALERLGDPQSSEGSTSELLTPRADMLQHLGSVEGVIIHAENNALLGSIEERIARQQARARLVDAGVDGLSFAGGFIPGYGVGIGALDAGADVAGLSPGAAIFPTDAGALDAASEDAQLNLTEAQVNFAALTATANGAGTPPVASFATMTDEERQVFIDWLLGHYDQDAHAHLNTGFLSTVSPFGGRR